ncbi:MAG TPA: SDR family NAD(P)-dependent oxidoreductase, partial [Chromatiales bacterium]|nr:SDR family NAD(P)-dependent oxidoreductase [Chromatiales bacterium]
MENQVVLITGAARRVGAVIARTLHARGMNIVLHYRASRGEAEALRDQLNAIRPGSAIAHACDLHHTTALEALIEASLQGWGRLDALVNNASTFYPTPVGEITETQWDDLVGTNLKAPLFLSQAAAPHLKKTA